MLSYVPRKNFFSTSENSYRFALPAEEDALPIFPSNNEYNVGSRSHAPAQAAAAAGEKSVHMIPQKELLPLTGYVHGGCSPIGMKKPFPTFLHASAEKQSTILFSAGKIGHQVELSPEDLKKVLRFSYAELTAEEEDTK